MEIPMTDLPFENTPRFLRDPIMRAPVLFGASTIFDLFGTSLPKRTSLSHGLETLRDAWAAVGRAFCAVLHGGGNGLASNDEA
jgi:hypothetical protein